jgi:hypothetical protein
MFRFRARARSRGARRALTEIFRSEAIFGVVERQNGH